MTVVPLIQISVYKREKSKKVFLNSDFFLCTKKLGRFKVMERALQTDYNIPQST